MRHDASAKNRIDESRINSQSAIVELAGALQISGRHVDIRNLGQERRILGIAFQEPV